MSTLLVNTLVPVSGDTINVSGSLSIEGEIILGDSATDSISFDGKVSSSILPSGSNIFDLGSSTFNWNNVHAKNFIGTSSFASNALSSSYALTSSHTNTADTVTANAQPNITSVGNLTALQVNQIVAIGVTASGTVAAALFAGDGSGLTNITASVSTINTGVITSSLFISESLRATDITASGNISASGTVFADNFQSAGGDDTISFTDDLKLVGNLTSSGNISSSGTITANILQINDNLKFSTDEGFTLNNHGANGFSVFSASAQLTNIDLGGTRQKFLIPVEVDGHITASGNVIITGGVIAGSVTASNISASGTITANSLVGTLTTAAQSNITSLGILTSLTSSGNISSSGDIIANKFTLPITSPSATDSNTFTANGNKIQMKNRLQSAIVDGSNQKFTINNNKVTEDSVIYGNFVIKSDMMGLSQSIIQCHTNSGSFDMVIHNESGFAVSNNTPFTASFVVM